MMQVMLCDVIDNNNSSERYYCLCVIDDNRHLIAQIPVLESTSSTGMTIQKWKHSTRKRDKGKNVIAVYYYISAMGHELDQWRYYDIDLEEDVTTSRKK